MPTRLIVIRGGQMWQEISVNKGGQVSDVRISELLMQSRTGKDRGPPLGFERRPAGRQYNEAGQLTRTLAVVATPGL